MKTHALAALLLVWGCEHTQQSNPEVPPEAPRKPAMMPTQPDSIAVTWKLAREPGDKALQLDYEIENRTTAPIWVLDQLVTTSRAGMVVLPDRVIVRQGPDAATASFVAGFTSQPGHAIEVEPAPLARPLAAGAKLAGTKQVPLPLASWHPYDSMIDALPSAPTKAVFEISWLPEHPPAGVPGWEDPPAATGGTLHLPTRRFVGLSLQTAHGGTLAIP